MNTTEASVLTEPAVLALMRAEEARLRVEAERLWQKLKSIEEERKPLQDAYEAALQEWNEAQRLADSLAAVIKSKNA